jgi:hypothetical protein
MVLGLTAAASTVVFGYEEWAQPTCPAPQESTDVPHGLNWPAAVGSTTLVPPSTGIATPFT